MRKLVCPQCRAGIFCVKNEHGERLPVYVTSDYQIIPKDPQKSLEGYDLTIVYCLCCSWKGSPRKLVKY